ncbi:uncharacterized protein LOC132312731 [Cornus florida]|uniref:uncharacterized protein LOC132312731 n=1 Tax=Cornus florida TaxID=4283 RepID=UPI002899E8D6|nr:uncharacterized protein LOC132312731 [Cornus florida]
MECNRDEAIRAKVIAERKLTEKDLAGAKKFTLKAQSLYPGLEGLSQLLTTVDVYISAENKVSGEVDWYGVLGVNPSADDDTVKKQYRKLALILHPDKNKSVGADGAFKLLSEAWSLLSDKTKRLAYNQRRSLKGFQQKAPAQSKGPPSAPSVVNGFHNFTNNATSNVKTQSKSTRLFTTTAPPPSHRRTDTFWTICNRCKMHYEYLKIYLNHTLLCPNCREAFTASEMSPPINFSQSNLSSRQRHQNSSHHVTNTNPFDPGRNAATAQNLGPGVSAGINSFNHTHVHRGPFSRMAGVGSTVTSPSTAAKAANVIQQANEKVKREREEAETAAWWEKSYASSSVLKGERPWKKKRGPDDDHNGYRSNVPYQMTMGNSSGGTGSISGLRKSNYESERAYGFSGINNKPNSTRELTLLETRNMLMEKAWREIRKKLTDWRLDAAAKAAEKEKKVKESKKERVGAVKGDTHDPNGFGESFGTKRGDQAKMSIQSPSVDDTDKEELAPTSMDVPDPDFHDFDLDRTESCFSDNQVWAAYDDDDGMPRFYAIIHKVVSLKPFKMRISWLNSKTTNEFGPVNWIGSGFSKTCGEFRVGKHEINKSLNSFSHKVKWTKGTRGAVCIFPQKGDVWALYRNWSPDWNEHTPDEVIHKYDMVEVLDDYNEDQGVSVTPLVKVAGFRTVFHPHLDPVKVRRIRKEEMFRFSHQVPNYLLTGQEAQNAPQGCQELDPAASPLELLQVITEANEVPMVENGGKVEGETLLSTLENQKDEIMDNSTNGEEEVMVENVEGPKAGETMVYKKRTKEAAAVDNA